VPDGADAPRLDGRPGVRGGGSGVRVVIGRFVVEVAVVISPVVVGAGRRERVGGSRAAVATSGRV
jgi:hypothetical protein